MISFQLTEEQAAVQEAVRRFAQEVVAPHARNRDEAQAIPASLIDAVWRMQLVGSRSAVTNALVCEELAAADASVALLVSSTVGTFSAICDHGTAEQRKIAEDAYLGAQAAFGSLALLEPRFGFRADQLATRAKPHDDGYVLNGCKAFVPMANGSAYLLVVAAVDRERHVFVVPADSPGVTILPARGSLGLRSLGLTRLDLSDVRVPAGMRLGVDPAAVYQNLLDRARTALAAMLIGVARAAFEYAIPYLKERVAHGTALARKQAIAFRLADMHVNLRAMRLLVWRAAWALENGLSATRQAQLAFIYAKEQAFGAVDEVLQAFGGHGYIRTLPVEKWYRNARSLAALEGVAGL